MKQSITVGIDMGSQATRIIASDGFDKSGAPIIVGAAKVETHGLRHGYIVNQREAGKTLRKAVDLAQKTANKSFKKTLIAMGGISLSSDTVSASLSIPKNQNYLTESDINRLAQKSEDIFYSHVQNRRAIHAFVQSYTLDGKQVLGNPVGMKGVELESKTVFVSALEHHVNDLVDIAEEAGLNPEIIASPYAASLATLSEKQKMTGCALVDIGAETVSVVVFENGSLISLEVFPIGSTDITNDIALGFKIPLEDAEKVKLGKSDVHFPKKQIEKIISARLSDIFDLVSVHLKSIGKHGLLPAGIVIIGGGSYLADIDIAEFARHVLKLPSQVHEIKQISYERKKTLDPSWFVSYGLCFLGTQRSSNSNSMFDPNIRSIKKKLKSLLEQLLP